MIQWVGVKLSRKTIALISVLLILMFSWTLGNLVNVYHDIPGNEGHPYERETRNPTGADIDTDIKLNKYVVFGVVLVIIGAWLYFSTWDQKIKLGIFALIAIGGHGLIFILNKYVSFSSVESVFDINFNLDFPDFGRPDIWSMSNISRELGLIIMFSFVGIVIGVIVYERYSSEELERDLTREEIIEKDLTTNIEKAIKNLKKGKDPRNTILRCYWKTCYLLEDRGVKQNKILTPREFKDLVLSNIRIEEKPLDELTDLFEEARYSSHEITEIKREKAIKDLKYIKSNIGGDNGSSS